MKKRKILFGCAAILAGYAASVAIIKKAEEIENKKRYDEIMKDWKNKKREDYADEEKNAPESSIEKGYSFSPDENILVVGKEGSGKTQSVVIPCLLEEEGSAVVNDPNGEIYEATAHILRKKGYHVYFINLSEVTLFDGLSIEITDIKSLSTEKTVIYISGDFSSATENTEFSLLSLFYDKVFTILKQQNTAGLSKYPVRFYLDRFTNCPQIPDFLYKLNKMQEYNASVMILLQSIPQLQAVYNNWQDIANHCDTVIFLGSTDSETLRYFSEEFDNGMTSIDVLCHLSEEECIVFHHKKRVLRTAKFILLPDIKAQKEGISWPQ